LGALVAKNPLLDTDPVAKQKVINDIENSQIALQLRRRAFPDLPEQPSFAGFSAKERKK
jgi:hypothetical protein